MYRRIEKPAPREAERRQDDFIECECSCGEFSRRRPQELPFVDRLGTDVAVHFIINGQDSTGST